jgi:hypothetical protein
MIANIQYRSFAHQVRRLQNIFNAKCGAVYPIFIVQDLTDNLSYCLGPEYSVVIKYADHSQQIGPR